MNLICVCGLSVMQCPTCPAWSDEAKLSDERPKCRVRHWTLFPVLNRVSVGWMSSQSICAVFMLCNYQTCPAVVWRQSVECLMINSHRTLIWLQYAFPDSRPALIQYSSNTHSMTRDDTWRPPYYNRRVSQRTLCADCHRIKNRAVAYHTKIRRVHERIEGMCEKRQRIQGVDLQITFTHPCKSPKVVLIISSKSEASITVATEVRWTLNQNHTSLHQQSSVTIPSIKDDKDCKILNLIKVLRVCLIAHLSLFLVQSI